MSDLNSLASALMELDDKLIACMKCGLCQAVCPVFGATMLEGDVTRGKIALLENLAHKIITDADAVNEKLGRCLLCGSCQANCPSGVSIMEIFMKARQIVTGYLGLSPIKRLIFQSLLTNPKLFNGLLRIGQPFQKLFLTNDNNCQGTACAPLLSKFLGNRHFAPLPKPLHATVGEMDTPIGASGLKVAFFPGCLGDKLYPNVANACLKVFAYHGVGVYLPKGFACCGIPALASGDKDGAIKQTRVNVDVLKKGKFDYIITPCGSCTATIKEWWPQLAAGISSEHHEAIEDFSKKVMDINAFLIDVLKVEPRGTATGGLKKITYHDPCHLKKSLGIASQPRDVIKLNPAYELVEMAEADRCCGCGGSFNLQHYSLSKTIGKRKRDNIAASGAESVATGCPACMMQITDMLVQENDAVHVKHPIEVYAEILP